MTFHFNAEDFESIAHSYIFLNQSSGTNCLDYSLVTAKEFGKDFIILEVPANSCTKGHSLMLVMFEGETPDIPKNIDPSGKNVKGSAFIGIGRITVKESLEEDEERSVINLQFTQYDMGDWKYIRNQYTLLTHI